MGDSLSDRGELGGTALGNLSGLVKSPDNRFTNGYVWSDFLGYMMLKNDKSTSLVTSSDDVYTASTNSKIFIRTFAEGGSTSHNYKKESFNLLTNEIERLLVSNLEEKRALIRSSDFRLNVTEIQKLNTLVIEWTGANDMILVNEGPSRVAADKAVAARMANLKSLIEMGYNNFLLLNLPNLSLAPRYKNGNTRDDVNDVVIYFNTLLSEKILNIKNEYPNCSIDLYDVNSVFSLVAETPQEFGLDANKIDTPLTNAPKFYTFSKEEENRYMFWDEVHPTEAMHKILSIKLSSAILALNYDFEAPKESLVQLFKEAYGINLENAQQAWCGMFTRKPSFNYLDPNLTLETIFTHAYKEKGRTLNVIQNDLGWVDRNLDNKTFNTSILEALKARESHDAEITPPQTERWQVSM